MYLTDAEVYIFRQDIANMRELKRPNVALHVLYKREVICHFSDKPFLFYILLEQITINI